MPQTLPDKEPSGLTGMLMHAGIVKNAKQANYLYVGLIAVLAVIMFVALGNL